MTFLEQVEKICSELEKSENPFSYDPYQAGFNAGSHKTRRHIARKLRYAIGLEQCGVEEEDDWELTEELL